MRKYERDETERKKEGSSFNDDEKGCDLDEKGKSWFRWDEWEEDEKKDER